VAVVGWLGGSDSGWVVVAGVVVAGWQWLAVAVWLGGSCDWVAVWLLLWLGGSVAMGGSGSVTLVLGASASVSDLLSL
jgi:hypothetical protein